MASTSSSNSQISLVDETKGIAFLGTPFKGSTKAKWAEVAEKMYNLFPSGSSNKDLRGNLEVDSQKLATLGEEFPDLLRRNKESSAKTSNSSIRIMCFFEQMPTKAGMIVDRESASLPGEEKQSLAADHKDMCKFADPNDPDYKRVLNVLREWVQEIRDAKKDIKTTEVSRKQSHQHFWHFNDVSGCPTQLECYVLRSQLRRISNWTREFDRRDTQHCHREHFRKFSTSVKLTYHSAADGRLEHQYKMNFERFARLLWHTPRMARS